MVTKINLALSGIEAEWLRQLISRTVFIYNQPLDLLTRPLTDIFDLEKRYSVKPGGRPFASS